MSCSEPVGNGPVTPDDGGVRLAVTTAAPDFTAANFEIISVNNGSVSKNLIPALYTDLSIRAYGNDVYILERFGKDNVVKYDAKKMAVEYQQHLGTGLNIQDIAVVSETRAYISCNDHGGLIVFNPKAGEKVSEIDLSQFNAYAGTDSAETSPYAGALAVYDDYVYVACQRLKTVQTEWGASFAPADTSLIAIIDTRTNTVAGSVRLEKKNPSAMSVFGDRLLVSSSGDWFGGSATAGIEMIDLTSNENLGLIADGGAFGGNLTDVIFVSSDKAYAAAMAADWTTCIIEFNPQTRAVGSKIAGIYDGCGGLAYDGSKLYIGDRGLGGAAGVAAVNPSTNTVERIIFTGMPPAGLAVIYK
jgi:hypothetical protein